MLTTASLRPFARRPEHLQRTLYTFLFHAIVCNKNDTNNKADEIPKDKDSEHLVRRFHDPLYLGPYPALFSIHLDKFLIGKASRKIWETSSAFSDYLP